MLEFRPLLTPFQMLQEGIFGGSYFGVQKLQGDQDYITTYDSMDAPDTSGSSLKGHLGYGITYGMLVEYLGLPTYLPEDSGDGKVNFQWVVEYNDDMFTIYDWKTESPEWSRLNTGSKEQASEWFGGSRWHVGGKTYAGDFIDCIEKEIKELVAR